MSRLVCPVCEKPVRRVDAKFCPHCGVAFGGNWSVATLLATLLEMVFWLGLMILLFMCVSCLAPTLIPLLVWVGLALFPQRPLITLTPVLVQPPWKLWLKDVFLAAILAFFFLLVTFFFCAYHEAPKAFNDQLNDQTAHLYRNLVVNWLLWIVLTASYYLLLIFRTGGKRRLMPRERFVALFCAFVVVFWGFMLLGLKVSLSNP
jgi:magnesium-transporting ATPase (P-type)